MFVPYCSCLSLIAAPTSTFPLCQSASLLGAFSSFPHIGPDAITPRLDRRRGLCGSFISSTPPSITIYITLFLISRALRTTWPAGPTYRQSIPCRTCFSTYLGTFDICSLSPIWLWPAAYLRQSSRYPAAHFGRSTPDPLMVSLMKGLELNPQNLDTVISLFPPGEPSLT